MVRAALIWNIPTICAEKTYNARLQNCSMLGSSGFLVYRLRFVLNRTLYLSRRPSLEFEICVEQHLVRTSECLSYTLTDPKLRRGSC